MNESQMSSLLMSVFKTEDSKNKEQRLRLKSCASVFCEELSDGPVAIDAQRCNQWVVTQTQSRIVHLPALCLSDRTRQEWRHVSNNDACSLCCSRKSVSTGRGDTERVRSGEKSQEKDTYKAVVSPGKLPKASCL